MPIIHHMIVKEPRSTKQYMTSIHRKNIIKDLTTVRTNRKRDKSLFRNGYLVSLLKPLKSIRSEMHIGRNLKLANKNHRSHIGATTSIDDKLTHLASNGTSSVKDLFPLTKLKGNVFDMEALWITNSSATSVVTMA